MTRTVLVTGGAGFIGSNLVRLLLAEERDLHVVTFDALTYAGNLESLADVFAAHGPQGSRRHRFVRGDVTDAAAVASALAGSAGDGGAGVDIVLHLAAESHVDRSIAGAAPFVRTNVLGTQVILDAVRAEQDRSGRSLRVVHVSTDEVYGTLAADETPWTEESPLEPTSPYAATKAASDCLALAWHKTYGLDVVITRCGNNYGPYQFPEKLIPLATTRALAGAEIPVYGDGLQVRDWIHVTDHARAIWTVARRGRGGEVYNVGSGTQRTNRSLLMDLLRAADAGENLLRPVADRLAHDRRYALDGAKLARETGWTARVPLERGLVETVEWYRTNRAWWERVQSEAYRLAETMYLSQV